MHCLQTPTKIKPQMDSTSALFLCFASIFLSSVISISDHSSLVYKSCANQTFTTTAPTSPHTQTLTSLFQELTAHSNQSKFFKHTESIDDDEISGVYQCRGDITNQECHSCVSTLPDISNTMCRESVSARVQLHGCYMHYKLEGSNLDSYSGKERLLHKSCSEGGGSSINGGASGFEEMMRAAFGVLESGVVSGEGFCKTRYELMDVMAQCEGGLGGCECGECVSSAVEIAEEECGGSVSGEIYLAKCFLSFAYHPDDESHPDEEQRDRRGSNGKTLAIVVGGAAALSFGFIFLLFLKSWGKKEEY